MKGVFSKFSIIYTETSPKGKAKAAPKGRGCPGRDVLPLMALLNPQHKNLPKTTFTALKEEIKKPFLSSVP